VLGVRNDAEKYAASSLLVGQRSDTDKILTILAKFNLAKLYLGLDLGYLEFGYSIVVQPNVG